MSNAALESVAAQTVPLDRLQVVVVVNGSSDRTAEVVRAARERFPRLEIRVIDDPLPGVARAKNIGARLANGDLLVFLDADSRMAPDLVERIVAAYEAGHRAGSVKIAADDGDLLDRGFYGLIEFGKGLFGIHANMLYCDRAPPSRRSGGSTSRSTKRRTATFSCGSPAPGCDSGGSPRASSTPRRGGSTRGRCGSASCGSSGAGRLGTWGSGGGDPTEVARIGLGARARVIRWAISSISHERRQLWGP
ncbi:MAG: hypothetical protein KatS3mg065_0017 [Chloroflexota bacterium]|nr:MAG: hypothetical protein KatS3mg065_0017 [Chloroflexota bacterium]